MLNFFKTKKIKMVWKISNKNKESYLIGTTHMFHHRFTQCLNEFINSSDVVVLECPLDDDNLKRVLSAGIERSKYSLHEMIDKNTIYNLAEIYTKVTFKLGHLSSENHKLLALKKLYIEDIENTLKKRAHWASFFTLWYDFLKLIDWKHSMDLEAQKIAQNMNKEVFFLEKPEEQIEAMDGIPPERIVNFIKKAYHWEIYTEKYSKLYLKGRLNELLDYTSIFPTRCESIIDRRDPILFERMLPYIDRGNSSIFVGITHIPGIISLMQNKGLKISPYER